MTLAGSFIVIAAACHAALDEMLAEFVSEQPPGATWTFTVSSDWDDGALEVVLRCQPQDA